LLVLKTSFIISISSITGKEQFTHPRVRSAYRSLITNLPYLLPIKMKKILWFITLQMLLMAECFRLLLDWSSMFYIIAIWIESLLLMQWYS